ncbi:MAG TPA: 16S rRNA (guanine(527)-N(7))-methyltransferase RsmG [Dehalococcoidia bacterium]|nr:16S rRNA (guanine(527)-N(7))-methyltransferase RsmG [Dehalococcoidia bacterium]
MMQTLSVGASLIGHPLDPPQMARFEQYMRILLEWNERFNLTSITSPREIETRHFLDSLSVVLALEHEPVVLRHSRLLDIGSGAGFPGIPLKIAIPELEVYLLEATGKKVDFLRHITHVLGLSGIVVIHGRAEELGHQATLRETFDVVVSRAVAPLATLVELGLPFVRRDGLFIAMKKGDTSTELDHATTAVSLLGGHLQERIDVDLPGLPGNHHLICIRKTGPTPARFPRRPGMPARNPL